jgi:hypothetical protein
MVVYRVLTGSSLADVPELEKMNNKMSSGLHL